MKVEVLGKKSFDTTQNNVLESFVEFQKALIDKDTQKLNRIISDDYKLVHMSGKIQTKEEFINEVSNGTLNYYKSVIDNVNIEVDGKKAIFKCDVTLTAKVYGSSGVWTLNSEVMFRNTGDKWIIADWDN